MNEELLIEEAPIFCLNPTPPQSTVSTPATYIVLTKSVRRTSFENMPGLRLQHGIPTSSTLVSVALFWILIQVSSKKITEENRSRAEYELINRLQDLFQAAQNSQVNQAVTITSPGIEHILESIPGRASS